MNMWTNNKSGMRIVLGTCARVRRTDNTDFLRGHCHWRPYQMRGESPSENHLKQGFNGRLKDTGQLPPFPHIIARLNSDHSNLNTFSCFLWFWYHFHGPRFPRPPLKNIPLFRVSFSCIRYSLLWKWPPWACCIHFDFFILVNSWQISQLRTEVEYVH